MSIKPMTKVCGVAVLVLLLVFAALGPAKLQLRTGFGWQIDHVVGYFAFTLMVCLAWPRTFVVGGAVTAFAVLLEGLQAFTPDRMADLHAAMYSAGGVLAAALHADLFIRARRWLNGRALLLPERFGPLCPSLNYALTRLTADRRGHVAGSIVARGVAPQSSALAGLVSQQLQSS
jgi:VanZ family protein